MRPWKGLLGRFLFPADSDSWLTILRIGLGLQVLAYCFTLRHSWHHLLSSSSGGLIGREVSEAFTKIQSPLIPRLGWLIDVAGIIGIGEGATLSFIWTVLLVSALLLVVGLLSRPAAVTCWLLHLCAAKSSSLVSYGVDNLMTVGLFYLMLSPLPDRWSLDWHIRQRRPAAPAYLGFFRRVLQLHLCVIYLFGGLTKALGSGWWNGENLWRALTRPPFDVLPIELIADWHLLLPALGISVWLIELTYPVLIWPRKTRLLSLTAICLMHFGIGFAMGMHLFAVVMIVFNVAAFGPTDDHLPAEQPPGHPQPT